VVGQIAAATGLGGIGKTQLASEFVHRYGRYFSGGVFWLSLADPQAVPAEVAAYGGPAGLNLRPDFPDLSLPDQVALVLSAWQSALPCLLVFDNCEVEALPVQWRPPAGAARVLVTSRQAEWSTGLGLASRALDVLPRPESIALLRRHHPELDARDPTLDAIADTLGDLPLALHLAGSFLRQYRHAAFGPPAAYLDALGRPDLLVHPSMTDGDLSPTGHVPHLARTFALSHERLDPTDGCDALALALLARAACLAPGEPIPRALLLVTAGIGAGDADEARRGEDALARLVALGLVMQQADGTLAMHRLLVAFVRHEVAGGDEARVAVGETLRQEASRIYQEGFPAPLLVWQPHLRRVAEVATAVESEEAGGLWNALDSHLHRVADYAGARDAFQRALDICEAFLGREHPSTRTVRENLGMCGGGSGVSTAGR